MEIEKRGFIDSFKKTAEKLRELGFEKKETVHITDNYFCREHFTTLEEVQMDEPGSYGLRTREKEGVEKTELNCKVIRNKGDHQAFIEHETMLDSGGEIKSILKAIGFKRFCRVEKSRTKYEKELNGRKMAVNLEDFQDFPHVIEIEVVANQEVEKIKREIQDVMNKLVNEEDLIEKTITLLYFKENAEF